MLFKIIKPTYINESLKEVGETVDYPVENMAKNYDGTVNMAKHSSLEPLEDFPAVAKPDPIVLTPGTEDFSKLIVAAVNGLDQGNDDHWTEAGKPNLKALELSIGFKVTRDQAEAVVPNARRDKVAG